MNYALAKEIYGGVPWHVDSTSFTVLQHLLENARSGNFSKENKSNTPFLACVSETRIIQRPWQLNTDSEFDGVGVININGAIVNESGESTYGMLELSNMMLSMASDRRIKGFIVLGNSGGGSSAAVETMGTAIQRVKNEFNKPVYGLIERGGTSASAMYMIHSYCSDGLYAQSEMSTVGSNGTMVQFSGIPKNKEIDGVKHIRLYATKSVKKNEAFESAINDDNYEVIVNDLLNPLNERALKNVLKNRPQLKDTNYHTGVEVFAKDGVGTYIDGFASFNDVVGMILNGKPKVNNNTNKSKINNSMTLEQLKSEHPEVYNQVYNSGVEAEQDRCGAWLAHLNTDSAAVVEGIKSGKPISSTAREELLVKASSNKRLQDLKISSPAALKTEESNTEEAAQKSELEAASEELSEIFKNL